MLTEHAMNMLTAGEQALASIPLPTAAGPIPWEEFAESPVQTPLRRLRTFDRDTVDLRIELGCVCLDRDAASKLRTGAVVPLDNSAYDPVAVYADGELIARGELLEVDGKFGVRVVEVVSFSGDNDR